MRQVTLNDLADLANQTHVPIWNEATAYGREPKLYLHWSAGTYEQAFDDYHINIYGDGSIYISGDDLSEVRSHTWKRNTGSIGIALCCAYGATPEALGSYAPTAKQIETLAQVVQVLADALWLTIDKAHVMTHGEAADNEDGVWCHSDYGPKSTCERWDLEYLGTPESPVFNPSDEPHRGGSIIRGKANWYRAQKGRG